MLDLFTSLDMDLHLQRDRLRALIDHKRFGLKSLEDLPRMKDPKEGILLGHDIVSSIVMGKPIPWLFANYILNAKKCIISKEGLYAASMRILFMDESKKYHIYDRDSINQIDRKLSNKFKSYDEIRNKIDFIIAKYDIDYGVTLLGHSIRTRGEKAAMQRGRDEASYSIARGYPMLTTQFTGIYSCGLLDDFIYPKESELLMEIFDEIKVGSPEHQKQIKAILTKLEQPGQAFYGFKRIQKFPLNVEPNKRFKRPVNSYDVALSKIQLEDEYNADGKLGEGQYLIAYDLDLYNKERAIFKQQNQFKKEGFSL